MRRTQWTLAMAIVLGVAGCSTHAAQAPAQELPLITTTVETTQPSEWTSPVPEPPVTPAVDPSKKTPGSPELRPRFGVAVEPAVRRVSKSAVAASAMVVDREANETILAENIDQPYAAGSLVKLLIGWDAMRRHPGDEAVRRRVFTMIQASDDQIASGLWVSGGGTAIIARARVAMGLKSTEPPVPSGRWGNTMITARDLARIYDHIMTQTDESDRNVIVGGMKTATKVGADGFKQYFGIPSATNLPWAIKQAWATDSENHKLTHSTGFVGENWRYVVIVLTEHPAGQSWDVATRSVTAGTVVFMKELG